MKRTLVLIVVLMLSATVAFGQAAGVLGVYMDIAGNDCNLTTTPPTLQQWHFVHQFTTGATAIQFQAVLPACSNTSFIGDTPVFAVNIGTTQLGIAIGYGVCLSAPVHVLTINAFPLGAAGACCLYPIVGDPNTPSNSIEVVDCIAQLITNVPSQTGIIADDGTCACSTPVEETTWGHIKSIYSVD